MKANAHNSASCPAINDVSMYDIEAHVAEIYDRQEDYHHDVDLIRRLLGTKTACCILEPFCGTGRISIPLALDGHSVVGVDRARVMLDAAEAKAEKMGHRVRQRITLIKADVLNAEWPQGFDLVILGGNCLYELASAEEQERCIAKASHSAKNGAYIYLDNEHMEGPLEKSWQRLDVDEMAFPTGICADGTRIRTRRERIWCNVDERLVQYRRKTTVTLPNGDARTREYLMRCHPPSTGEVTAWLDRYGFVVEKMYGDRSGGLYEESSQRAIFWARKS